MTDFKVLRTEGGKVAVHFVTPAGVHGYVDTSISQKALTKFVRSLRARIRRRERRLGRRAGHSEDTHE